ncbi:hypothetical protein NKR23_g6485 [Pleurostoma richardsiae]|uniref:Uncharacterized protein n=1 Tax=Pleurostoma richardsiae TaxID=41990 RepID=A0AA38VE37_9PEZI|nr:hypothetical protein NKR23_g6485 [Pleurostoma richardsiae]
MHLRNLLILFPFAGNAVAASDPGLKLVYFKQASIRATYFIGSSSNWNFDPHAMDREDVLPMLARDVFCTMAWSWYDEGFWWFSKLANGSYIALGNYIFRFAALTMFGNPEHPDNWGIWKTPEITVLPFQSVRLEAIATFANTVKHENATGQLP